MKLLEKINLAVLLPWVVVAALVGYGLFGLGVFDNQNRGEVDAWRAEHQALFDKYHALAAEQRRLQDEQKQQAEVHRREREALAGKYVLLKKQLDALLFENRSLDDALPERPVL